MPDKHADKSILEALQGWKARAGVWLRLAVAIGLASGVLLILQAWLLASTINAVVFDKALLYQVMPWLWGLLLLFLVRAGLAWAAEHAAFQAAVRVKLQLREQLYRHVQKLGPAWLSAERTGDVVNAISDGVEALDYLFCRAKFASRTGGHPVLVLLDLNLPKVYGLEVL